MSATQMRIAEGNADQAKAWDGDEGQQWAANPEFYERAVRRHHARLMAAANIAPDERILDIGCGTGGSTADAARAAERGHAVGVDLSSAMLVRGRALAADEGLGNVSFVQADAQVHHFEPGAFDVAISRLGSMFFSDQVAAFTNIARALRPDGRLVLVSWRTPPENEWLSEFGAALSLGRERPGPPPDAPSPFAHADIDRATRILEAAGFSGVGFEAIDEPMYFGSTAAEAHSILSRTLAWMMEGLDTSDRSTALARLRETLDRHETEDGVAYGSAAWLITARRIYGPA